MNITLDKIYNQIGKHKEQGNVPDEIHMNQNTLHYLQREYQGDYICATMPLNIFGLKIKIEEGLRDNEVYLIDSKHEITLPIEQSIKDVIQYNCSLPDVKNNTYETKSIPLTHTFNNGEVRLEIVNRIEDLMNGQKLLIPTIRLNGFVLTNNTIFDVKDLDKHILRNVMIKLKEFEEELRSKI